MKKIIILPYLGIIGIFGYLFVLHISDNSILHDVLKNANINTIFAPINLLLGSLFAFISYRLSSKANRYNSQMNGIILISVPMTTIWYDYFDLIIFGLVVLILIIQLILITSLSEKEMINQSLVLYNDRNNRNLFTRFYKHISKRAISSFWRNKQPKLVNDNDDKPSEHELKVHALDSKFWCKRVFVTAIIVIVIFASTYSIYYLFPEHHYSDWVRTNPLSFLIVPLAYFFILPSSILSWKHKKIVNELRISYS